MTYIKLTPEEIDRMAFLLGQSEKYILTLEQNYELRKLIDKQQACPINFDEMVNVGFLILGKQFVLEKYKKYGW